MRTTILVIGLCCLVHVSSNSRSGLPDYEEFRFNALKIFPNLPEIVLRLMWYRAAVTFDQQTLTIGFAEEANKIVGGTAAAEGEFPHQAILNLSGRLCGGTLISTSIILTAAHCVAGLSAASTSTFKVTVNATKLNGGAGAVSRGVRKFVMHASYNSTTNDNDIALLALVSPITNVRLAKLPLASTSTTYAGQLAVIIGWGTTSAGGNVSQNLLKANVYVLTNTACNLQYDNKITSNMVCAAAPGADTCQGDSGGPMLVEGVQIGITSFGKGCADPRFAGVYTRVTPYISWITTMSFIIQMPFA